MGGVSVPLPLVSAVMPTYNRRAFIPRAVAQFLEQDYQGPRELIVVDDGTDPIEDLLPLSDERVRLIRLEGRLPLGNPVLEKAAGQFSIGAKRNLACEAARGEFICHWDDDDWFSPRRLTYQVGELLRSGADLCGLRNIYYHEVDAGEAWKVRAPNLEAGGTFCYRKSCWESVRFSETLSDVMRSPQWGICEDAQFIERLRSHSWFKELVLDDPTVYVVAVHSRNTCEYLFPGPAHRASLTPEDERFLAALVRPKRMEQLKRFNREHGLPDPETWPLEEFRKRAGLVA